jgi:hypothetical protein
MYNFSLLDKNNYIADDLETINLNYRSLSDWTLGMETSAKNLWAPLVQLFSMRQPDWEFAITRTQQYSARWLKTATVVESYSAGWIKPLALMMPNIYRNTVNFETLVYTISGWINDYFPVLPNFNAEPSFVEGQEAFVYNYYHSDNFRIEDLPIDLYASATCLVYPGMGWANCTTRYSGVVDCNGGALVCDGQFKTCPVSKAVDCSYTSPPYIVDSAILTRPLEQNRKTVRVPVTKYRTVTINGEDNIIPYTEYESRTVTTSEKNLLYVGSYNEKWSLGIGYIKAKILFNYTDTRENTNLQCIKFKVKNCKWEYDTIIGKNNEKFIEPQTNGNCKIEIVDIGSEKKRGYYYVNNNGFITLKITGVGPAVNHYFEININGISKLIPPGGSTVTFGGFYSRTYVAKIQNLTSRTKHSFTVSIGYNGGTGLVYQAYDRFNSKALVYKKGDTMSIFT